MNLKNYSFSKLTELLAVALETKNMVLRSDIYAELKSREVKRLKNEWKPTRKAA